MLPDTATIVQIEQFHALYQAFKPTWELIDIFREGAKAVEENLFRFFPKRPGEDTLTYNLRLSKHSYTPILSKIVRSFVAKLMNAPITLSGIDPEDQFWSAVLNDIDGNGSDQDALLTKVFSSLLYFGKVGIGVDTAEVAAQPRSLAEDPNVPPRVIVYEASNIVQWGTKWYLTKQYNDINEPLQPNRRVVTYTFWMPNETVAYSAEVTTGLDGLINTVLVDGQRYDPAKAQMNARRLVHNLGRPTFEVATIEPELCLGMQLYGKQRQHLIIESSWTDAGSIAGTVQRLFTPEKQQVADDPRTIHKDKPDTPDFGNARVLIGDDFRFVEATGGAVGNLTAQLDKIEAQVASVVSLGYEGNQGANQSAAAKEVDQAILNDTMRRYGRAVRSPYQRTLQTIADLSGRRETVQVNGLDTFNVSSLDGMVTLGNNLLPLMDDIPPTALRIWFGKLCDMLAGLPSPDDANAIQDELANRFDAGALDPNNPEDVAAVKAAFGLGAG
jgi:hypothetical protein